MRVLPELVPGEPAAGPRALAVVVVADCPQVRRQVRSTVEADDGLRLAGEVRPGDGAPEAVERLRPDVILLDLPAGSDGGAAVERLLALSATPILVCAAGADSRATVAALAAGAVGVAPRPGTAAVDTTGPELRRRIHAACRLPVAPRALCPPAAASRPSAPPAPRQGVGRVVAVGASTGGPSALATLLRSLPEALARQDGPAVVVVQHMADGFVAGLADWLDGLCALPVGVAREGERLAGGRVVLAPGGGNLLLDSRLRLSVEPAPSTQFHVPGIDATFASVARAVGSAAVGVLLTGMGRDGAEGLCALRASGALTLGQDEDSCAVYGMPAAALRAGGVVEELPLADIGPRLVSELRRAAAVRP